MNKKRILPIVLSAIFVILIAGGIVYVYNQQVQDKTKVGVSDKEKIKSKVRGTIILRIPIIEYKIPGNVYSEAIVKGYDEKPIEIGEEFIIDPANLIDPVTTPSRTAGNFVGDIKLKLIDIRDNSIVVDILADERFDKKFYPREKVERKEIKNGDCISAFPLVMDVSYQYCFDVIKSGSQIILKPRLKSESTMPLP